MGLFGYSNYPPGAANDPNAPWNQKEGPCDVCGKDVDHCICPECPECGSYGDPDCYLRHGLVISDTQRESKETTDREARKNDERLCQWEREQYKFDDDAERDKKGLDDMPDMDKGLYPKYVVTKPDGTPLDSFCFVLRPDRDPAAVAGLRAYADATENTQLAADIRAWLDTL